MPAGERGRGEAGRDCIGEREIGPERTLPFREDLAGPGRDGDAVVKGGNPLALPF